MQNTLKDLAPNLKIGPYVLVSFIGRGSFGRVWLAERRGAICTTQFAIKFPVVHSNNFESVRKEAQAWVKASGHPNVLPLIEAENYDGRAVLVSEYAPDGSLKQWMEKHNDRAPTIDAAVDMVSGILEGLCHLHSHGVIHRDLKPDNILLQGAQPRLVDFGVARVLGSGTQSCELKGTPLYMAPEAFEGVRNERTDIWSVGVILYQMLSGTLPFQQVRAFLKQVEIIRTQPPAQLSERIPKAIKEVVHKALTKEPDHRFQSSAEMLRVLREAAQNRASPLSATEVGISVPDFDQQPTLVLAPDWTLPSVRPSSLQARTWKRVLLGFTLFCTALVLPVSTIFKTGTSLSSKAGNTSIRITKPVTGTKVDGVGRVAWETELPTAKHYVVVEVNNTLHLQNSEAITGSSQEAEVNFGQFGDPPGTKYTIRILAPPSPLYVGEPLASPLPYDWPKSEAVTVYRNNVAGRP